MKKILSLALVLVMLLGVLTGCSKEFTKEGLTISLTPSFTDQTDAGYTTDATFLYVSPSCAVIGTRDDRASLEALVGPLTLESYGSLIIDLNGTNSILSQVDGLYIFDYEATTEGLSYTYLSAVYESDDAFWLVQVYCGTEKYESQYDTMLGYLKSVTIS